MDRDKALTQAINRAKREREVVVLHQADSGEWHVLPYPYYHLVIDSTTRYVLPNGEVTKLA